MAPRKPVQFMLVAATSFHQATHTEGAAPKHRPVPCGQRGLKGFCSIIHTPQITSVFQLKRKGWYKAVRTQADKQCGMQGQPIVLRVTLSGPGTELSLHLSSSRQSDTSSCDKAVRVSASSARPRAQPPVEGRREGGKQPLSGG